MSTETRKIVELTDLSPADLLSIFRRATRLEQLWRERRMPQSLSGQRIALVVNDNGWRNTAAFDLGIQAMGGICVQPPLRWDTREDLNDLAAYLGNWFDAIVTRAPELPTLRSLANIFNGPVINARTKHNHPCETLGDLAFYFNRHGSVSGIRVAVISPKSNILGSWIEAAATLPLEVLQIYPKKWHDLTAAEVTPRFSCSVDMKDLEGAHLIITDCWPEDGTSEELMDYQINGQILDTLSSDVEFVPCPPVHRDRVVSREAVLHPACRVIEAKKFLLHAQNAALEWVFSRY